MTDPSGLFEGFPEDIQRGIRELGWEQPMPVQERVIPLMRAGRDLIVQAVTGSGKTGAFGLPIIEQVDRELRSPQALVLAPTRELGIQVAREIEIMGKHAQVETLAVYGGVAYGPQIEALERGVHVIAGTPGRILDHLKAGRMDLSKLRVLIFDEADELLSLGFWPDMREIQSFVPKRRQSGLFSATIPERVRSLARSFLNDPEFVSLVDETKRSPEEIEHYYYITSAQGKDQVLQRLIEYEDPESALIFCNTRDDVRYVTAFLQRNQFDADMIQGDMTQASREVVMTRIKAGELRFLVATDVAARGIDISDLSHVIAYTTPDSPEVYLHRTGRTGRAGKTGTAISLVSGLDIGNFQNMQNVNRMKIPERMIPTEAEVAERLTQRLAVKIEHELRELGPRERKIQEERLLPAIEQLAKTDEGRRDLSAILFRYLHPRGQAPAAEAREPRPRRGGPRSEGGGRGGRGGSEGRSRDEGRPRRDETDRDQARRNERGGGNEERAPEASDGDRKRSRRRRRRPAGAS
jgi:ATP-dependent RNA helicase DeaD